MRAALALALALALAACKDSPAPSAGAAPGASKAAPAAVSIEAIAAQARGFTAGSAVSARTVYVFFDPQCPHCAALWAAAKPLHNQAKFVWIPVGVLNQASVAQGAALLSASDPVAAMNAHEASLLAKQGGITAAGVPDAARSAVENNTKLFDSYGFASIPTIVARHAQSGELVTREGALPTAQLAQLLGLNPPAGT